MVNGRISRLSAFSDIIKEDGKRRLSNAMGESKMPMSDLEARSTDLEARSIEDKVMTDVFSISAGNQRDMASDPVDERHFLFSCVKLETLDIICRVLAEFVGTALLLLFACMGLIQWTENDQPYFVGGLVFGLTIMFVIQVVGAVSGSHINPSVTLAAVIYRKITIRMACMYVVAQFLGALVGFGILRLLTPTHIFHPEDSIGTCSPAPNPVLSAAQVFFFEYFASTVLIVMCCAAWDPRHGKNQDSMAIKFGLSTAIPFIAVSPATGCCINPARAFAPAVYNGDWDKHWVYWIAPLLAAAVTSTVYRGLFYREVPPEKKEN
ncbi:Aquaporin-4 [Pseudolycoriella hygida]|uniref:Aquaporin-4 n=1 Tax=Pseudolycoriella hygida TaxID=35572 RepID=A0A9Q0S2S5_9DIPT|nr:Aquaporin-4 [Pseudolycoriella hygida]